VRWWILEFVPTYHEWQNKQDEWVGNVGKPVVSHIMGCGGNLLICRFRLGRGRKAPSRKGEDTYGKSIVELSSASPIQERH
jgi:hypothetical protein